MTARRGCVLVSIALVLSCSKQQAAETASPVVGDAAPGMVGTKDTGDPAAQLAAYEAELAARKAELAARGVELAVAEPTTASGTPPTTPSPPSRDVADDELLREAPAAKRIATPAKGSAKKAKSRTTAKQKRLDRKAAKGTRTRANADAAPDACAPICGPADAICELSERICGLADEHDDESRYAEACERATDDCERAAEACEDCRD